MDTECRVASFKRDFDLTPEEAEAAAKAEAEAEAKAEAEKKAAEAAPEKVEEEDDINMDDFEMADFEDDEEPAAKSKVASQIVQ